MSWAYLYTDSMKNLANFNLKRCCFLVLLSAPAIYLGACSKDKALSPELLVKCKPISYEYKPDIDDIVRASCITGSGPGTGCHDAWILDYSKLKTKVLDGTISYRVLNLKDMPVPNNNFNIPALTQDELDQFECWILTGAKEN